MEAPAYPRHPPSIISDAGVNSRFIEVEKGKHEMLNKNPGHLFKKTSSV